jgi:hypothetical protein
MGFTSTISNGRPERKDVTAEIERRKKQQLEDDKQAAAQRLQEQAANAGR